MKDKIFKKWPTHNTRSYLDYLDKLLDEHNNTYHSSIGEKPIDTNYSAWTEELRRIV